MSERKKRRKYSTGRKKGWAYEIILISAFPFPDRGKEGSLSIRRGVFFKFLKRERE